MARRKASLQSVESAVGHVFKDQDLLSRSMTHSSVSADVGRDLERLGAVLLGQREVGVVDELEGVFIVLVELVGERALCENA